MSELNKLNELFDDYNNHLIDTICGLVECGKISEEDANNIYLSDKIRLAFVDELTRLESLKTNIKIEVPEGYEYDQSIKPDTTEYKVTPFTDWLLKQ